MRVPFTSAHEQFTRQIGDLNRRQVTLQEQIASGQRVRSTADDPAAAARALDAGTEKARLQTYTRNLDRAEFVGRFTLESLEQFKDVAATATGLALTNDGLSTPADLRARGQHMTQLVEQGLNSLNTELSGDYVFAGANTGELPFVAHRYTEFLEDDAGNYVDLAGNPIPAGDPPVPNALRDASGAIIYDTVPDPSGPGTLSVPRPLPPELIGQISHIEYTGTTDASDDTRFRVGENSRAAPFSRGASNAGYAEMLNDMIALRDAFHREDIDAVRNEADRFDETQDRVAYGMVELGAKLQGFETLRTAHAARFNELETDVSRAVDADLAESIVALNRNQTAYEAALSSGARLLDLSLLDYLR